MRVENVKGAVWTVDDLEYSRRRPLKLTNGSTSPVNQSSLLNSNQLGFHHEREDDEDDDLNEDGLCDEDDFNQNGNNESNNSSPSGSSSLNENNQLSKEDEDEDDEFTKNCEDYSNDECSNKAETNVVQANLNEFTERSTKRLKCS
jgi:hypothetical protein